MLERLNKVYPDKLDIPSEETIKRLIWKAVARVKMKRVPGTVENSNCGVPVQYVLILQSVLDCSSMEFLTPVQTVKYVRQSVAEKQLRGELPMGSRVS